MTLDSQDGLSRRIADWIDDIASHAEAADAIAAMREAAIPGIRAYLARGPQVVPQTRCFAVAMLARMHLPAATQAMREVLRANRLHSLSSTFAESEYVVKSGALEALATRADDALADDVVFGISERLRVAVDIAGRLQFAEVAVQLVDFLDDDVLAETAMDALAAMGPKAAAAIAPRLDAWLTEAEFSARRRLAVIRALRVMHHVHADGTRRTIQHASNDWHPAVRAAGALLAWPARRDATTIECLVHGAVGFDRGLADDCREALTGVGTELVEPVRGVLRRSSEPGLYGDEQALSSEQHDWLVRCMDERQ
ncbi:MAG: hypothetical protein ACREPU_03830 [Rhodanobacteraceae bacterium]